MSDTNRSGNRRAMNSIDDIDESHSLSELERIGARVGRRSIQRSQLEDRIRSEGKLLNSLLDEGRRTPMIKEGPFYNEQVSGLRASIASTRGRMNTLDAGAVSRAESEASTFISRQFNQSTINGQVSAIQRQEGIQNRAFAMSGTSFDVLQSNRDQILSQIRSQERGALNEVKGLFSATGQVNPEGSARLGVIFGGMQNNAKDLAAINAATQMQRMQGTDPTSRLNRILASGQDARGILSAASLAQEMRSGGVNINSGGSQQTISNNNIQSEIINQSRNLADALKQLAEGASKTDEELSKFRANAEEAADNLDKLKQAQGMGGGGGFNQYNAAMGIAGGFTAVGSAVQQIMVGQRLGQVGNISGFANLENQKYDMYRSARGGDVLSQLTLGQVANAETFGKQLNRSQNISQGLYAAGGAAQMYAGGALAIQGTSQMINPIAQGAGTASAGAQNMVQGAGTLIQGGATVATSGADILRNVSAGAANIQGRAMSIEAAKAIMQIPASQMQSFRDFGVGLGVAGQSMGGRGGAFLNESLSGGNLDKMIASRMSPEQFAQMASFGASNIGSTFTGGQIFSARGLERSGFGSMAENMQRMATLGSAGSNNPQTGLASVLEAAFSKGLDSSKALTAMVDNTAAIAQGTVGRAAGLDTTGASATLLAAGINRNDPNQEFAVQRAATAQDLANKIGTNTSATFSGMVATARIGKATGLGGTESILAQQLDTATLKSLQGMNGKDASAFYQNQGINVGAGGASGLTSKLLEARVSTLLEAGGPGLAILGNRADGIKNKIMRGDKLNSQENQLVSQVARLSNFSGGQELLGIIGGVHAGNAPNSKGQVDKAMSGEAGSTLQKDMDFLRTSGMKQMTEAAKFATENMNKFGGAVKVLVDLTKDVEKMGGDGIEGRFSTAASRSSGTFGESVGAFDRAVTKFNSKIDALIGQSGLNTDNEKAVKLGSDYAAKEQQNLNKKKRQ